MDTKETKPGFAPGNTLGFQPAVAAAEPLPAAAYAEPLSPNWKPSLSRPGNRTPAVTASGARVGRPPGVLNKVRGEAKTFCQEIVRSEEYRHSIRVRAKNGTLPPPVEVMIWHYAYGKPTEHVQVTTALNTDLSELSTEQLAERAKFISDVLRETATAKEAAALLDQEIDAATRRSFDEVEGPIQ